MNQAQTVKGMRISDMPRVRKSRVVVMKFSEPMREAPAKMARLMIHRVCPNPSPGPAISPNALKGA